MAFPRAGPRKWLIGAKFSSAGAFTTTRCHGGSVKIVARRFGLLRPTDTMIGLAMGAAKTERGTFHAGPLWPGPVLELGLLPRMMDVTGDSPVISIDFLPPNSN